MLAKSLLFLLCLQNMIQVLLAEPHRGWFFIRVIGFIPTGFGNCGLTTVYFWFWP